MDERRQQRRYRCTLLVRFGKEGQGEWAAVSRNVSRTGLLMAVGPRLKIGEPISMTFRVTPDSEEITVSGTVVRVRERVEDPRGYWPHQVAVEFDDMLPGLEDVFDEVESKST
jgi:hypothetical protein